MDPDYDSEEERITEEEPAEKWEELVLESDREKYLEPLESAIYEGRCSREQIEEKIALRELVDSADAKYLSGLTREEIENLSNTVIFLFQNFIWRTESTFFKWFTHGFNCSTNERSSSSHAGYNLGKLYLREAGRLIKGPSMSTSQEDMFDEYDRATLETGKRRVYSERFNLAFDHFRNRYGKLRRNVTWLKENWNDAKVEKVELLKELTAYMQDLYEECIFIALTFLPGRTFLKS
jgi:hypothetical protein